jgi:hypothetical protein
MASGHDARLTSALGTPLLLRWSLLRPLRCCAAAASILSQGTTITMALHRQRLLTERSCSEFCNWRTQWSGEGPRPGRCGRLLRLGDFGAVGEMSSSKRALCVGLRHFCDPQTSVHFFVRKKHHLDLLQETQFCGSLGVRLPSMHSPVLILQSQQAWLHAGPALFACSPHPALHGPCRYAMPFWGTCAACEGDLVLWGTHRAADPNGVLALYVPAQHRRLWASRSD